MESYLGRLRTWVRGCKGQAMCWEEGLGPSIPKALVPYCATAGTKGVWGNHPLHQTHIPPAQPPGTALASWLEGPQGP